MQVRRDVSRHRTPGGRTSGGHRHPDQAEGRAEAEGRKEEEKGQQLPQQAIGQGEDQGAVVRKPASALKMTTTFSG